MNAMERVANYRRQNGERPLTPKQRRRLWHKVRPVYERSAALKRALEARRGA